MEKSTNSTYKKILIISHRYSPAMMNPRAFRWSTIAEHWASIGHSIDIITIKNKELPDHTIVKGTNVFRTTDYSLKIRSIFFGKKSKKETITKINTERNNFFKYYFLKILVKTQEFFFSKLFWPDKECLWIIPTYLKARKLFRDGKYDAVITVARPFSSHIVGLLLGKKMNGSVWICDIGDPFSFDIYQRPNNLFLYKRLNRMMEKKIFKKSGKISVTTKETVAEYMQALKLEKNIFTVIPPLFSLGNVSQETIAQKEKVETHEINLAFFGHLYANIRNPSFLLKLIDEVNNKLSSLKVNVHFYGYIHDCIDVFDGYKLNGADWIFTHDTVERKKVAQLMVESDILVNIGNLTSYQLPSKIIEYISTGKPILNITSIANDSSSNSLKEYPSAFTIIKNSDINSELLDNLIDFLTKTKSVDKQTVDLLLMKHSKEFISDQYMRLIENGKFTRNS